jgi:hypothetical protein
VQQHTILADQSGISKNDIDQLLGGGKVSQMQLQEFFDAGYTEKQALEVILALVVKLISNYTNSIAGTPLDKEV